MGGATVGEGYREFREGWKPLLAAAVATSFSSTTLPFNIFGATIVALQQEHGWGRGEIALCYFWFTLTSSASFLFVGGLVDRFGARPLALVGVPLFAIGLALMSLTGPSLVGTYAAWAALGLAGAAATPITFTRIVTQWFVAKRGLALAVCLGTAGIAAFFQQVLSTYLVEAWGWRTMFVVMGLTAVVLPWPVLWALFREPSDRATAAASGAGPDRHTPSGGLSLRETLAGYRFYVLVFAVVAVTFGISGVMINFKPLLGDAGIAPATAAWIAGAVGFAVVIGRLTAGFLFDRIWAPGVASVMLMAPAVSCLLLMPEQLTVGVALSAGLLIGLATGAEGDLMPYLTSRYFGLLHYGKIYGLLLGVFFLASGIAPFIVGRVFDVSGSYAPALLVASVLFVFGGAALLALGRYPDRWPSAARDREEG